MPATSTKAMLEAVQVATFTYWKKIPFPQTMAQSQHHQNHQAVMSSAAEMELGMLYINACKAVEIRQILEEMGHPQPPMPIQTDNSTAEGIINSKVQPKQPKS